MEQISRGHSDQRDLPQCQRGSLVARQRSRGDPDLVKGVHEYDLSRGREHRSLAHQNQPA
jgi:hypothetical protein